MSIGPATNNEAEYEIVISLLADATHHHICTYSSTSTPNYWIHSSTMPTPSETHFYFVSIYASNSFVENLTLSCSYTSLGALMRMYIVWKMKC